MPMQAPLDYLVWSCEHQAWWGPNRHGYVKGVSDAGRYSRSEAIEICRRAIPQSSHLGWIAEIPVAMADIKFMAAGQLLPEALLHGSTRR